MPRMSNCQLLKRVTSWSFNSDSNKLPERDSYIRLVRSASPVSRTHPLSSAAKKVVAKFKPKFEGPYKVLDVHNNNLVVWKLGKRLSVNVDLVRLYHQRESDENEIRVGNSNSSGSRYQAIVEGVRRTSNWSQNKKKSPERGSGKVAEQDTCRYNLRPRRSDRAESRLSREQVKDQRGPGWPPLEEEEINSTDPTIRSKKASSSQ
ncbi:hypothetical protein TNCV_4341681 [Trichonephila clavipes]|nr:hypothetical protein TNCV_4341681 [Trichonephila clavipes]